MLRERPTQIKVDSRRDEGGRLRTNTLVWSILLLTSLACTEVITNEENISGDLDVNPCLFELSIEELAGRPCLTEVIESLRDAPADQQVGCVHLRWTIS